MRAEGQEARRHASISCAFHLEEGTEVVRYPCPFIPSYTVHGSGEGGPAGKGSLRVEKGEREAQARRLSRKLPPRLYGPEERVIPFNRGIEFFPDAESSWHRVRTTPPPPYPPYYPAFPLPRVTHTRVPAVPPTTTRPLPSPRYPADSTFAVAAESCP